MLDKNCGTRVLCTTFDRVIRDYCNSLPYTFRLSSSAVLQLTARFGIGLLHDNEAVRNTGFETKSQLQPQCRDKCGPIGSVYTGLKPVKLKQRRGCAAFDLALPLRGLRARSAKSQTLSSHIRRGYHQSQSRLEKNCEYPKISTPSTLYIVLPETLLKDMGG